MSIAVEPEVINLTYVTTYYYLSGNTYTNKEFLKKMQCKWNATAKVWVKYGTMNKQEIQQLDNLKIKVERFKKDNVIQVGVTQLQNVNINNSKQINILGGICAIGPQQYFTRNGRQFHLQKFTIADTTATINAVLWNSNNLREINLKGIYLLRNVKVQGGKDDTKIELHCGKQSEILLVQSEISLSEIREQFLRYLQNNCTRLFQLTNGYAHITGMLTDIYNVKSYVACPNCASKIGIDETICPKCKEQITTPDIRLICNIIIDDDTDAVKCTIFGDLGASFLDLEGILFEEFVEIDLINNIQVAQRKNRLLGSFITLHGRTVVNEHTKLHEFLVSSYQIHTHGFREENR